MSNTNQQNMITQGTTLVGDIFSEGDFRIEGNIKGNIKTSGKIVVGKTGVINGSLEGENADFEGGFQISPRNWAFCYQNFTLCRTWRVLRLCAVGVRQRVEKFAA